jgi:class 3 adenylate cyclase
MRLGTLRNRYVAGLALAYLLTAAEVVAIVVSLGNQTVPDAQGVFSAKNLVATVAVLVIGTVTVVVGGMVIVAPLLAWLGSEREPTARERRTAVNISLRQTAILSVPWAVAAAVLIPLNVDRGVWVTLMLGFSILFGATASVSTGFLFTQRTLRPLLVAAAGDLDTGPITPGVRARLMLMWTVCTALPGLAISLLILMRRYGWIIDPAASVEVPVLVLTLVGVALGLRAMMVVAQSISDPVHQVVDAMAEVEQGRIGRVVDVYERSEIGRLQRGFNRMVAGLRERDHLRDLFGRHVGEEVVRRAVEENESLSGDERDVAVLFIDLVGSMQLTSTREPHEVAEVLNEFFQIVVAAVDERHGLINKFQGDAALAVFGAPLRIDDPASAALATARSLRAELRRLPVDFGIGVSAGPVFAGNIGAENRYEYTVVGDAVNEAARLADRAKDFDGRALCSAAAIDRADEAERRSWAVQGSEMLRGRSRLTQISAPTREGE